MSFRFAMPFSYTMIAIISLFFCCRHRCPSCHDAISCCIALFFRSFDYLQIAFFRLPISFSSPSSSLLSRHFIFTTLCMGIKAKREKRGRRKGGVGGTDILM